MNRRRFLETMLAAGAGGRVSGAARRHPNILLMIAGGWRGQTWPGADEELQAPNLARLTAEGAWFRRAYTANPEPGPGRAAILTGLFPHTCGVFRDGDRLDGEAATLAELLAEVGYESGFIGHWRLDGRAAPGYVPPGPRRHGFTYWAAANRVRRYYDAPYFLDSPEPRTATGFEPEFQARLAAGYIRRPRENPFFLCLAWGPPAGPRAAPSRYRELYRGRRFSLRLNVPAKSADAVQQDLARYYAMCSALDACAGLVLDALEKAGAADGTIVVFTSDSGDMLGSHGLEGAGVFYEEAVRVPLVIRYPSAVEAGSAPHLPVSTVDILPTVLYLAGFRISGLPGRNLAPVLAGGDVEGPESVYCQGRLGSRSEWRMVVRGFDKVVVDRGQVVTHLFHLGRDPYEMENLAGEKAVRRTRDEMRAILRDWMRRAGDKILPSGLKVRE